MSTISAGTTVTTALVASGDTTGALTFQVNGTTTAATITTAGNLGIGTTSPGYRLDTQTATSITQARFSNSATGGATITSTAGSQAIWAGGTEFNGTAFVARATTSSQIRTDGGLVTFFTNDSLTSGNTFTPSERMRIDSSGNVGIGVTPSAWGSDTRALQVYTRTSLSDLQNTAQLTNNGYWNGSNWIYIASAAVANYLQQDGAHIWRSAASGTAGNAITFSERMRITSGGKVLVNTTATVGTAAVPMYLAAGGETWQLGPEANGNFAVLNDADVGVFIYNGQTSWSSTSDERVKTDLVPIADALNKVSSLRTVTGRYIKDAVGTSRSFLIAQDVQAVFPEAVDVPKKESDPLGLRYTDVIPLLVAAINELKAENDALKARIEALETK